MRAMEGSAVARRMRCGREHRAMHRPPERTSHPAVPFRVLAMLLMLLAVPPALGDTHSPARKTRGGALDLVQRFHPLEEGMVWRYQVTEGDRSYEQTITAESAAGEQWLLKTRSPRRRTEYRISRQGNDVLLHEVRARFSFLPVWRSRTFEPPLVFVSFEHGSASRWEWHGVTEGFGPDFEQVTYVQRFVKSEEVPGESASVPARPGALEVAAECWLQDGVKQSYRARYATGVGLVEVEAAGYHKRLVAFQRPKGSGTHAHWESVLPKRQGQTEEG